MPGQLCMKPGRAGLLSADSEEIAGHARQDIEAQYCASLSRQSGGSKPALGILLRSLLRGRDAVALLSAALSCAYSSVDTPPTSRLGLPQAAKTSRATSAQVLAGPLLITL